MAAAEPVRPQADRGARRPLPFFVPFFNRFARRLAASGLMGPNVLLTVAGRKSGVARSTPVAMVEIGHRRWIIGTFGAVGWVLNLRAARQATITVKGRRHDVEARELTTEETAVFFRDVLAPYVKRLLIGPLLLRLLGARDLLTEPEAAAKTHPVFELT